MEDKFHDVLSSVDAKQGRSPLEPYGELVDTLRAQGSRVGISPRYSLKSANS